MPRAFRPSVVCVSYRVLLEVQFKPELKRSRAGTCQDTGNNTETVLQRIRVEVCGVRAGIGELRGVRQGKRFAANLQAIAFLVPDHFHERRVELELPRAADCISTDVSEYAIAG